MPVSERFRSPCPHCGQAAEPTEHESDEAGSSAVYDHCGTTWTRGFDELAPVLPLARVTIRLSGPVPVSALEQMFAEHGVSAEHARDDRVEESGIDWSADVQAVVTTILASGGTAAIGAAIAAFRRRFPKAKVDVNPDVEPDDGGFLG